MPYGFGWKFTGSSGVCSDGSAWNAPRNAPGTQAAYLQRAGAMSCGFAVAAPGMHTLTFRACQRSFVAARFDLAASVDGADVLTVKAAQLSTSAWKTFAIGVNLAAGPHTLAFRGLDLAGIDCTGFVDDVAITPTAGVRAADTTTTPADPLPLPNPGFESPRLAPASYIKAPPEVSTPGLRLDACVMPSGRTLYGRVVDRKTGAAVTGWATGGFRLAVNGVRAAMDPARLLSDADHDGSLWALPDGLAVAAGDTVTLEAGESWAITGNDYAEAMDGMPVANCVGRGAWAVPEKARLMIGLDFGNLGSPHWSTYSLSRNLRHRMQYWDGNTVNGADGRWYPTSMKSAVATAVFLSSNKPNFLDATGMPAPEGLYAIGWKASSPTTFAITGAAGLAVTERTDLASLSGPDKVRVFDVRRAPGATAAGWSLSFSMGDATRKPALDYMVIFGPGDFAYADGQPVELDNPADELAPSRVFLDRVAGGVGTLRFGDCLLGYGGTDCCEPEHVLPKGRFTWFGWYANRRVAFTQARPFDGGQSPYVYSPLFGEPFPATLGSPMEEGNFDDPEFIDVPDAATAPVIEGLVLSIGDERCRVLKVQETRALIERGSEGTTPTAHDPGPITVSGRTAVSSVNDFKMEDTLVTEFVTRDPHGLRTLQQPVFTADQPWPILTYADGAIWNPARSSQGVFVTGPTTFVVASGKAKGKPNATLAAPVAIDPAKCFIDHNLHENFSYPHEFCASLVGRVGADAVVNMPIAASDSYVDAVAKIWRDGTKAGQVVWVEYINEPWNWSYIGAGTQSRVNWLLHKQGDGFMTWQVRRTAQMVKRFKAVFAAAGREADARGFINMQQGSSGKVAGYAKQVADEGLTPLDYAVAPYTQFYPTPALMRWLESSDTAQAVDAWVWNIRKGVTAGKSGPIPWMAQHRAAVDAVNRQYGTSCRLLGYECGVELPWPAYYPVLAEAIDATAAAIKVSSNFPIVPGQFLRFGDLGEWVKVTDVASVLSQYSLTVERGAMGTKPSAYAVGARLRNAHAERGRDLIYHPDYRLAQMEEYQAWQEYFDAAMVSIYCGDYVAGDTGVKMWGMYHHFLQRPARGDGRDGAADHTACLARPGMADSKEATENQDAVTGSVRGRAFLDWNRWARCNRAKGAV